MFDVVRPHLARHTVFRPTPLDVCSIRCSTNVPPSPHPPLILTLTSPLPHPQASVLAEVADNVARSPFRRLIAVPRPVPELCTKHVLVMEYLPGRKLVDGIRESFRDLLEARGGAAGVGVGGTGAGAGREEEWVEHPGKGGLTLVKDGLKARTRDISARARCQGSAPRRHTRQAGKRMHR